MKNTLCLLLLAASLACSPVGKQKRINILFEKANKKLAQKSYFEAIQIYDQILSIETDLTEVLQNRGVAYFESGQPLLALADYNHILSVNPNDNTIYFNRVNIYLELDRLESCRDDINYLKVQYPDSSLVYFMEGMLNHKNHQNELALESFSKAISLDIRNAEAFANRGMVFYEIADYSAAEQDLISSLKLDPGNLFTINALALVKADQGVVMVADSLINKVLRTYPDNPIFLNNRGYINIFKGDFQQAEKDILESLRLNLDNAWAYQNLGILEYERGNKREAAVKLEKAIEMEPELIKAKYYLIKSYFDLNRTEDACRLLGGSDDLMGKIPEAENICLK